MPYPRATAATSPRSAPSPASDPLELSLNAASKNTTVSKPSRMTARNAIATRAKPEPTASADVGRALQLTLQIARVPFHPTTM